MRILAQYLARAPPIGKFHLKNAFPRDALSSTGATLSGATDRPAPNAVRIPAAVTRRRWSKFSKAFWLLTVLACLLSLGVVCAQEAVPSCVVSRCFPKGESSVIALGSNRESPRRHTQRAPRQSVELREQAGRRWGSSLCILLLLICASTWLKVPFARVLEGKKWIWLSIAFFLMPATMAQQAMMEKPYIQYYAQDVACGSSVFTINDITGSIYLGCTAVVGAPAAVTFSWITTANVTLYQIPLSYWGVYSIAVDSVTGTLYSIVPIQEGPIFIALNWMVGVNTVWAPSGRCDNSAPDLVATPVTGTVAGLCGSTISFLNSPTRLVPATFVSLCPTPKWLSVSGGTDAVYVNCGRMELLLSTELRQQK
jgi:hypothetical protein